MMEMQSVKSVIYRIGEIIETLIDNDIYKPFVFLSSIRCPFLTFKCKTGIYFFVGGIGEWFALSIGNTFLNLKENVLAVFSHIKQIYRIFNAMAAQASASARAWWWFSRL